MPLESFRCHPKRNTETRANINYPAILYHLTKALSLQLQEKYVPRGTQIRQFNIARREIL